MESQRQVGYVTGRLDIPNKVHPSKRPQKEDMKHSESVSEIY